jgi:hypothetical protein
MKNASKGSGSPKQDFKLGPFEYKAEILPGLSQLSVAQIFINESTTT